MVTAVALGDPWAASLFHPPNDIILPPPALEAVLRALQQLISHTHCTERPHPPCTHDQQWLKDGEEEGGEVYECES